MWVFVLPLLLQIYGLFFCAYVGDKTKALAYQDWPSPSRQLEYFTYLPFCFSFPFLILASEKVSYCLSAYLVGIIKF